MPSIEQKVANLEKKVAVLENENEHVSDALTVLSSRITGINDKKLTPMQTQLQEIHDSLRGSKGFIAGVLITVSIVWTMVATFGYIVWNWVKT